MIDRHGQLIFNANRNITLVLQTTLSITEIVMECNTNTTNLTPTGRILQSVILFEAPIL